MMDMVVVSNEVVWWMLDRIWRDHRLVDSIEDIHVLVSSDKE